MSDLLLDSKVGTKFRDAILLYLGEGEQIFNVVDDTGLSIGADSGPSILGGVMIVTSDRLLLAKPKLMGRGLNWWWLKWADVAQMGSQGPHFAVVATHKEVWKIYHKDEDPIRLLLATMNEAHTLAQKAKAASGDEQMEELRRRRGF